MLAAGLTSLRGVALRLSLFGLLALSACTVQLAPAYDPSVVTGLNAANVQTQTLFATVSTGVTPGTFPSREAQYNTVIGQFSAIESQLEARPMPSGVPGFLTDHLPPADAKAIHTLSTAPSIADVKTLIDTLTVMRDTDRKMGLPPSTPRDCVVGTGNPTACLFENSYRISFNDALTYEMALQR
jgi:hypothetical protein